MQIIRDEKTFIHAATHAGLDCYLETGLVEAMETSNDLGMPPGDMAHDILQRYLCDPDGCYKNRGVGAIITVAGNPAKEWPLRNYHAHPLESVNYKAVREMATNAGNPFASPAEFKPTKQTAYAAAVRPVESGDRLAWGEAVYNFAPVGTLPKIGDHVARAKQDGGWSEPSIIHRKHEKLSVWYNGYGEGFSATGFKESSPGMGDAYLRVLSRHNDGIDKRRFKGVLEGEHVSDANGNDWIVEPAGTQPEIGDTVCCLLFRRDATKIVKGYTNGYGKRIYVGENNSRWSSEWFRGGGHPELGIAVSYRVLKRSN